MNIAMLKSELVSYLILALRGFVSLQIKVFYAFYSVTIFENFMNVEVHVILVNGNLAKVRVLTFTEYIL